MFNLTVTDFSGLQSSIEKVVYVLPQDNSQDEVGDSGDNLSLGGVDNSSADQTIEPACFVMTSSY